MLVNFGDSAAFAREINALLGSDRNRQALSARAYARGRTMIWSKLAERAVAEIGRIVAAQPRRLPSALLPIQPLEVDLTAVERMSDATGMLQHAIYSVPDRRHGYCIDDNARALILMCEADGIDEAKRDKWMSTYASFVQYAWNPERRRFRNFMNYDRTWCEEVGSEDSNGRTLWALGVAARDGRTRAHREWAIAMWDATASLAFELESPRAQSFAMLGAAAVLEAHAGHQLARSILERFPDDHLALLCEARRPEWEWFEIVLAYDNARLPEALLRAGRLLGRQELIDCGVATLDWIVAKQTAPGRVLPRGRLGKFRPALCRAAAIRSAAARGAGHGRGLPRGVRGDRRPARWVAEGERAYGWFLGAERPRPAACEQGRRRVFRRADADRDSIATRARSRSWRCNSPRVRFRGFQKREQPWQGAARAAA